MPSENGWNPARANGATDCEWVRIPGAEHVSLQFLKGQPLTILRAFAADFHAYIEPLRDHDSAAYTPTNSVATSNHLNGTAMDLNWQLHPFRVLNAGFDAAAITRIRELLAFYTFEGLQIVWWGNDWRTPKDAMHWNMGYGTYGDPRVQRFIAQRIRPDGFSSYKRAATPPPAPVSKADGYAVRIIAEGRRRNITERGIKIALATALVESNIKVYANPRVPESMQLPHDDVASDAYSVGIFQQQVRDTGNGWWWGDAKTCMGVESSAALFYDRLARLDYNGRNSPGSYAQAVQKSAYPDRYDQRYPEAERLYNRLASTPTTPAPAPTEGFLMALSDAEQREVLLASRELTKRFPSRSPLRHLGEGLVDTVAGFLLNTDGHGHVQLVSTLARLGHPESLALLREVAAADPAKYPDRQADRLVAQAILADITTPKPAAASSSTPAAPAPVPQVTAVVDTSELRAAYEEIAKLREENARLQAEAAARPADIAPVYNINTTAATDTPEAAASVIRSVQDWTQTAIGMGTPERAALAASLKVLALENGNQQ